MSDSKYACKFCGAKLKAEVNKVYDKIRFLERVYMCGSKEFTEFSSVKWIIHWSQECTNKKPAD